MEPLQPSPFANIDHPAIYWAQAICATGLFVYFFKLRHVIAPIPQIVAILAFAVLVNLAGRVMKADWFVGADILQYWIWAAMIWTAILLVGKRTDLTKDPSVEQPLPPDWLDRWQYRLIAIFSGIVALLVLYATIQQYNERQDAKAAADRAAIEANTKAAKADADAHANYSAEQKKAGVAREKILTGMASLSATQQQLLSNQKNAKTWRKANTTELEHITLVTDSTNRAASDIKENMPASTPKTDTTKHEKKPEKKPFWKRWFSRRSADKPAAADSTKQLRTAVAGADSLAVY